MVRATTCFRSIALLLPILGSLLGCAQRPSWDDYASKTETMKFMTFVRCDTLFVSTEHQIYYHVTSISANADSSYRVGYHRQSQWAFERIYFRSVSYIGLQNYTAISSIWPSSEMNARCAALVVLPRSSTWERPFFYANESQLRAAATIRLSHSAVVGIGVFFALLLLCCFAMDGFLEHERKKWAACPSILTSIVILNASMWWLNFQALANIDALSTFYRFYDALPTSGGYLLPLQWSQAQQLFAGPPHPTSLVVYDDFFYTVLCYSALAWLVLYARRIFIGIAYAATPDPFEELCRRFEAQGRVPTHEDYLNVLTQTAAGKSARQWELLNRRMKERLHDV